MAIYLALDGIDGNSTDNLHPHTFECFSFAWGASEAFSAHGGGRPNFAPISVAMNLELRTPEIMLAVIEGKLLPTADLYNTHTANGNEYDVQKMEFKDVVLTAWGESGSGDLPAVQLTFVYRSVRVTSQFQNADGRFVTDVVEWNTRIV